MEFRVLLHLLWVGWEWRDTEPPPAYKHIHPLRQALTLLFHIFFSCANRPSSWIKGKWSPTAAVLWNSTELTHGWLLKTQSHHMTQKLQIFFISKCYGVVGSLDLQGYVAVFVKYIFMWRGKYITKKNPKNRKHSETKNTLKKKTTHSKLDQPENIQLWSVKNNICAVHFGCQRPSFTFSVRLTFT